MPAYIFCDWKPETLDGWYDLGYHYATNFLGKKITKTHGIFREAGSIKLATGDLIIPAGYNPHRVINDRILEKLGGFMVNPWDVDQYKRFNNVPFYDLKMLTLWRSGNIRYNMPMNKHHSEPLPLP